MSNRLPPLGPAGFSACVLWLLQTIDGKTPDPELLTRGLPQGRLWSAAVPQDAGNGSPIIAAKIRDEHKKRTKDVRTPRDFDLPAYLATRLLQLAKTDIRLARNVVKKGDPEKEGHWLSISDDLLVTRIIADAQPGEIVEQIDSNHYNLCRSNLRRVPGPSKYAARALAIKIALANFDKLPAKSWQRRALTREEYEWLLRKAFELLDEMHPLGEARS